MLCLSHILSMMFKSSSVGILVYMLEMSSDANFKDNLTNIEEILNLFNNIIPGLAFTLERERDGRLNFLDLTIKRSASELTFEIFRKPTTTDTIIPNDSCHPLEQKFAAFRIGFTPTTLTTYKNKKKLIL